MVKMTISKTDTPKNCTSDLEMYERKPFMSKHTILEVKKDNLHLFLQGGFFDHNVHTSSIHLHGYTEIHVVINGEIRDYIIGTL